MEGGGEAVGNGAGKGFDDEADDAAQAEALTAIAPGAFHHFGKAAGHEPGVVHFIDVAHEGDFDTAAKGFDEIADEAGAVAPQVVDEPDAGLEPAGDALPLDGVVEEGVAVVEGDVDGCLGAAFFSGEEILRGCFEVTGPEGAGPAGFQLENAGVGVRREFGEGGNLRRGSLPT